MERVGSSPKTWLELLDQVVFGECKDRLKSFGDFFKVSALPPPPEDHLCWIQWHSPAGESRLSQ